MTQLAKNSELQTEAIQNLKEDILLCSGDEDTEDNPALEDDRRDSELDIAATLDHVLDSSDINNTTSVKSPESGSQSALVESLTQAFTKSKVTSHAIEGKIAELMDKILKHQNIQRISNIFLARTALRYREYSRFKQFLSASSSQDIDFFWNRFLQVVSFNRRSETIGVKTYQFHAKRCICHHVKLNCFKDDNVKIVFASTLNVFLLVIKFCSLVRYT